MTALWGRCGHQLVRQMEPPDAESCYRPHLCPSLHLNEPHLQRAAGKSSESVHINVTVIRRHQQLLEGGIRRMRRREREWQPEGRRRGGWKGIQAREMARKEEGSGGKQTARVMWSAARNGHAAPWATLALHKMCCITLMGNEGGEWQKSAVRGVQHYRSTNMNP